MANEVEENSLAGQAAAFFNAAVDRLIFNARGKDMLAGLNPAALESIRYTGDNNPVPRLENGDMTRGPSGRDEGIV